MTTEARITKFNELEAMKQQYVAQMSAAREAGDGVAFARALNGVNDMTAQQLAL